MIKRRIIFRISNYNQLTFPLLLNVWEQNKIHHAFEIIIHRNPLKSIDIREKDIVIYSFMTSNLPEIHKEIKEIRKSKALIVGGGPHITGDQELPLKMGFDILFIGPGEQNFLKFAHELIDNQPVRKIYPFEISADSQKYFNQYVPISKYISTISPLEIMRGCHWRCNYCSTHFHKPIYRDDESILIYLRELKNKNIKRINFISPSSMEYKSKAPRKIDIDQLQKLMNMVQSFNFRLIEYGIFPSEIRPDTVTDEGMALLRKYVSHRSITIGAQSGLNNRLKNLRRGHWIDHIEHAVGIANTNGFSVNLDFIIGYPDETPDERQQNLNFIKRLNKTYRIKTHIHFFIPLPGSAYEYRFPSFLSNEEKNQFHQLKYAGITTDGWIENEKQAKDYFQWLRDNFPGYFSRYY